MPDTGFLIKLLNLIFDTLQLVVLFNIVVSMNIREMYLCKTSGCELCVYVFYKVSKKSVARQSLQLI